MIVAVQLLRKFGKKVDVTEAGEDAAIMIIAGFAGSITGRVARTDPSFIELSAYILPAFFVLLFGIWLVKAILRVSASKSESG